mmetsp:Transcript_27903/g.78895  ORF Transcript_27903/g.78895 Transcript_27903/m.78895 type:complete len:821 (-) Transcript_27903:596-3058(-)
MGTLSANNTEDFSVWYIQDVIRQRLNETGGIDALSQNMKDLINSVFSNTSDTNMQRWAKALQPLQDPVVLSRLVERGHRLDTALHLSCPAGHFCPNPSEMHPCPPGDFCPMGSVMARTCVLPQLVVEDPAFSIRKIENRLLIEEIASGSQIIQGNYCPEASPDPQLLCPGGSYCPTPEESIQCPVGYYCEKGSTSPLQCPWLSGCPVGSEITSFSWGGFIIGVIIIVVLTGAVVLAGILSRRKQKKVNKEVDDQEQFRGFMTVAGIPMPEFRAFTEIPVKVSIDFHDLTLTLKNGSKVLNGVTGRFPHSQLIAVMGGSGCGKSTFLNVLCGKANYGKQCGEVLINSHHAPLSVIKSIKGFVPQDDTVHEDLTVQENLSFAAQVRLPKSHSKRERKQMVLGTAELLQLTLVMNSVVGSVEKRGISGGQRKRVNIGIELVAQPSVLFLDEPTSGLDATASLTVLEGLKHLCKRGLSSIMVIHQPRFSIFQLFDQVLLLGRGGYQVYLGPSSLALPYFESKGFCLPPNENPADFFLDVIQGQVECELDEDFAVADLYEWWQKGGPEWVASQRVLTPAATTRSLSGQGDSQSAGTAGTPRLTSSPTMFRVPRMRQELNHKFNAMDTNGNGFVTPEELVGFFKGLGHDISLKDAQGIVQSMNNGNNSGTVSVSASCYMLLPSRPPFPCSFYLPSPPPSFLHLALPPSRPRSCAPSPFPSPSPSRCMPPPPHPVPSFHSPFIVLFPFPFVSPPPSAIPSAFLTATCPSYPCRFSLPLPLFSLSSPAPSPSCCFPALPRSSFLSRVLRHFPKLCRCTYPIISPSPMF